MMKTTFAACSLLILILQSCGRSSEEKLVVSEKTRITQLPQLLQQQQLQGALSGSAAKLDHGGNEDDGKETTGEIKHELEARRLLRGTVKGSGPGVGRGAAGRGSGGRTTGGGNTALRQKKKKSNGTSAAVPLSYLLHCIVALFLASILCTKV